MNTNASNQSLVESSGGATKAFSLNVNVNVDLGITTGLAAAGWILARAVVGRISNMKVNGHSLPPDESSARKIIMDAIDADEQKKGNAK